ncbi:type II secretion system protein [Gammaproteobacteria bacterium]|nr:type II secretion system protein [Gammaproteobacteria bacterium]
MLKPGFSLLEVGVALLILGLAVTSVFQFISSTTLSAMQLENRAYARQIANNRLALTQTLEPFNGSDARNGQANFGGKLFFWSERLQDSSPEFFELSIRVGLSAENNIYELRTFIAKK